MNTDMLTNPKNQKVLAETVLKEKNLDSSDPELNTKENDPLVLATENKPAAVKRSRMTQVSIAEFMYKNIHLLGFENTTRALNVAFRQCLDNSLDACNTYNIPPIIDIKLKKIDKKTYRFTFRDNGPGVDPAEVPNICCRLLYGDKFTQHQILRGQQGLGLTSLILYAQKTSNKPAIITVKRKEDSFAQMYHLMIDVKKNRPIVLKNKKIALDDFESGFIVEIEFVATYVRKGVHSPEALLEQYLYLNPNLTLTFTDDEGPVIDQKCITTDQPPKLKAVKHVPYYQQLGDFNYILKKAEGETTLYESLKYNFELTEGEIVEGLKLLAYAKNQKVETVVDAQIKVLKDYFSEITEIKRPQPEETIHTDPNLARVITKNNTIHYDEVIQTASTPLYFKHGVSRVLVYGFYGGQTLAEDSKVELLRVGNNSPLRYHGSSCLITKTVAAYNWKKVGFMQTQNELPRGKLILIVHVCATKLPYTSESKDAVAEDQTIKAQINECLDKLARQIKRYLSKLQLHKVKEEKCHVITKILPDLKKSLCEGLNVYPETFGLQQPPKEQQDLMLLSRIMESPCLYVHKDSPHMVCINPTNKVFKLIMKDKKTLTDVLEISVDANKSEKYLNHSYDPKINLFKGLSHTAYHVFKHAAVVNYELPVKT